MKIHIWKATSAVLALVVVVLLVFQFTGTSNSNNLETGITKDVATEKAVSYINNNLLQGGSTAEVKSVEEASDLFIIKVDIGGQEYDSYVSKDGKFLFPSGIDMSQIIDTPAPSNDQAAAPAPEVTKSDKPVVEVFIMSHCPFGTQIEKGVIPVAETLGDKIDFEIKFVNYAMHGKKELDEQLLQYCIQEEQNDKFLPYLTCFLADEDTQGCLTKNLIDSDKLDSCIAKTDTEFKVTELYNDESTWNGGRFPQFNVHDVENQKYGVRGSPTLVINGIQASAGRDSASLLNAICGAFNDAPEECSTELSSTSPSAGFGFGTATGAASDAAGCAS